MTKTNAEVLTTILIPKKKSVIHPHQEDLIRGLNHPMAQKLINREDLVVDQDLNDFVNFLTK